MRTTVLLRQSTGQPSSLSEVLVFKRHGPRPRSSTRPPEAALLDLPLCLQPPCARLAPPGNPASDVCQRAQTSLRTPDRLGSLLGERGLGLRDRSQTATVQMMRATPTHPGPSWRGVSGRPVPTHEVSRCPPRGSHQHWSGDDQKTQDLLLKKRRAEAGTQLTSSAEPSRSPLLPSPSLNGPRIYRLGSSAPAAEAAEEARRTEREEGCECCGHHLTSNTGTAGRCQHPSGPDGGKARVPPLSRDGHRGSRVLSLLLEEPSKKGGDLRGKVRGSRAVGREPPG